MGRMFCDEPILARLFGGDPDAVPDHVRQASPLALLPYGIPQEQVVSSRLATPIWVRGLQDRTVGVSFDSTRIDAGATASFRFTAKVRGAWYYSAGASPAAIPASDADGQLVGALVIDSIADDAPAPDDRVFVLTRWSPTGTLTDGGYQLNAMNGLSWPNTERLRYPQGDSIVWHVINPSNAVHEMHLHGFFFLTLGIGAQVATGAPVPPAARTALRVTTVVRPGSWVSIKWSPDRPGNWLFHCHVLSHMTGCSASIACRTRHRFPPTTRLRITRSTTWAGW
jgi:FtsP/CotA-like multicopper oxidase with cupredoxin domain